MSRVCCNDLDYLAARLHARRSRMAEDERLDDLCRLHTLPELGRATLPGAEFFSAPEFQRRLVRDLVREISGCLKHLEEYAHDLVTWLLCRFQWEDVKTVLRGFLKHTPVETLQQHLLSEISEEFPDALSLMAAKSLEDFMKRLPSGSPRNNIKALVMGRHEPPPIFVLEAALDAGYFSELIARNSRLRNGEGEITRPLFIQEANIFQFMLVARGRFHFGLAAETLANMRIGRSNWFKSLLLAPDFLTMAKYAAGVIIDSRPEAAELPMIEAMAWQRYRRLANLAFRRSHMGAAAVAGYIGLRRMEISNLITLSEGIRFGMGEETLRKRMISQPKLDEAYV